MIGIRVYLVLILLHWADASNEVAKDGKPKPGEAKSVKELLVCSLSFLPVFHRFQEKIKN